MTVNNTIVVTIKNNEHDHHLSVNLPSEKNGKKYCFIFCDLIFVSELGSEFCDFACSTTLQ